MVAVDDVVGVVVGCCGVCMCDCGCVIVWSCGGLGSRIARTLRGTFFLGTAVVPFVGCRCMSYVVHAVLTAVTDSSSLRYCPPYVRHRPLACSTCV